MEYRVRPEEAGKRVREILRGSMGVSYTALKSAKWNGRIRMNGEPVRTDTKAAEGKLSGKGLKILTQEDIANI